MALVDTGANISVIDWTVAKLIKEPIKKWNGQILKGVANNPLEVVGKITVNYLPDKI